MLTFDNLQTRSRIFRGFTGLSLAAFQNLLPAFVNAYQEALQREAQQRPTPRQRRPGGGRPSALDSYENKLIFILFYFRHYPTQEVLGFLFGLTQGPANTWIQRLTPLLNQALGYESQLPARTPKTLEALLKDCTDLELIIDGTERPIRRPKDSQRQKDHYSGKKKRHTKKNNVITDKKTGKILGLGATYPGHRHDKKAADEDGFEFPEGASLYKDTGFQGYEPPGVVTWQPKKKPRGKELTVQEKANNQEISRHRIGVEHSVGGVKIFGIVHDVFRHLKEGFDDLVMETACGLFNLQRSVSLAD